MGQKVEQIPNNHHFSSVCMTGIVPGRNRIPYVVISANKATKAQTIGPTRVVPQARRAAFAVITNDKATKVAVNNTPS
jgi:hypothetical protein